MNAMGGLTGILGILAVAITWALEAKRDPEAIPRTIAPRVQPPTPQKMSTRWSMAALLALCAMPVVQCFGYLQYRNGMAVFFPLLCFMAIFIVAGVRSPHALDEKREHSSTIASAAVVTAGIGITIALPADGTLLVLRGFLIDILGMIVAGAVIRNVRARSNQSALPWDRT